MALAKSVVEWTEAFLSKEPNERKLSPIFPVLALLGQLHKFGVFWRNCFFDIGIFSKKRVSKPVVSVGNIVCGGSGKTPFVKMLAMDIGQPVAILHRGYRTVKKKRGIISCPEEGDEAYMLAKALPLATVIVGKNRRKSALLGEMYGVKYHLLDDGMQYRYLERDVEITIVHKDDIMKETHFLPSGLLRETPWRLKKATYVIVNGVENESEFNDLRIAIKKYTNAPVMGTSYEVINKSLIGGKVIGAFCGIAKPKQFYASLHQIGCRIVHNVTLGDHRSLKSPEEFVAESLSKGAEMVVCTEKDYVKLRQPKNIVPLKIEMRVVFGADHYDELTRSIKSLMGLSSLYGKAIGKNTG